MYSVGHPHIFLGSCNALLSKPENYLRCWLCPRVRVSGRRSLKISSKHPVLGRRMKLKLPITQLLQSSYDLLLTAPYGGSKACRVPPNPWLALQQ